MCRILGATEPLLGATRDELCLKSTQWSRFKPQLHWWREQRGFFSLLSNCTPKCRLFNLSIALRDRLSYAHDPHVIRDPARVSRGIIRDANAREKINFSTTRTYSARTRRDHRAASARERARVKLAKLSERLCWRNDAREGAFCRIYTKTLPAFDPIFDPPVRSRFSF